MRIALIGYGAMGQLIEKLARKQGHEPTVICGSDCAGANANELAARLRNAEVAIDFSVAEAVRRNVEACIQAGIPLVEGTTGWLAERAYIERLVRDSMGAVVFGANFSLGVNLYFRIVEYAAGLFSSFPEYEPFIEEQHHSRKKDAPSGTALKLQDIIERTSNYKDGNNKTSVSIASTRAGFIPGTHRVGFDGDAEQIVLEHMARSRDGFAKGAILAAEWIRDKSGFYEFSELLDEIIDARKLKD